MSANADPLMVALNRLRKCNPDEFAHTINSLAIYTAEVLTAMVDAPQDQILEMQGRARQAKAFLRAFRECHFVERTQQRSPSP